MSDKGALYICDAVEEECHENECMHAEAHYHSHALCDVLKCGDKEVHCIKLSKLDEVLGIHNAYISHS